MNCKVISQLKIILVCWSVVLGAAKSLAQDCNHREVPNNWHKSWVSCSKSKSPNPIRPRSHWLLFEFENPQAISGSHFWNANRQGESGMGIKTAIIDYSIDGNSWKSLGSFDFPKATESTTYLGVEGPDFKGEFVSKILITVVKNYGNKCASIGEIQFNIDPEACYGELDACGVCDGNGEVLWYKDADGDGLGDPSISLMSCDQPNGFVLNDHDDCDNGIVGWQVIGKIFEKNGCTSCHNQMAIGGLNLNTYKTVLEGGNTLGTKVVAGEAIIEFINSDNHRDYVQDGDFNGAMKEDELRLIKKWLDSGMPYDCNCPEGSADDDEDGICNYADDCPNFDNRQIGQPCDDGSSCTTNDVWTTSCDCKGVLMDSDLDGICDLNDQAPNDPCTADGIIDGLEPEGWVSSDYNDCDLDGITVATGDLDDFSNCVDDYGRLNVAACNCADSFIEEGGILSSYRGWDPASAHKSGGLPDGDFTSSLFQGDTLVLQFPAVKRGERICVALGFSNGIGPARAYLNHQLMTLIGDPTLRDYYTQEFCFNTLVPGDQELIITKEGPGAIRLDGATYSRCPCNEQEVGFKPNTFGYYANVANTSWEKVNDERIEICEGQSLLLGGPPDKKLEYRWILPDGTFVSNQNLDFGAVLPEDSGVYWMLYEEPNACNLRRKLILDVKATPKIAVGVIYPSDKLNDGEIILQFQDIPTRSHIEFSIGGENGKFVKIPDRQAEYIFSNLGVGIYEIWTRWGNKECPILVGEFDLAHPPSSGLIAQTTMPTIYREESIRPNFIKGIPNQYSWREKPDVTSQISSFKGKGQTEDGLVNAARVNKFVQALENNKFSGILNREGGMKNNDLPFMTDTDESSLQVYPNPVARGDNLAIRYYSSEAGVEIKIVDAVTGRLVQIINPGQVKKGWNNFELNFENFAAGTYLIVDGNNQHKSFVLID